MIRNPQKANSNIFGNRELSKEEHERIKNEKINPLDRYIISIPDCLYQGTNLVQSTKEEFLDFIKQPNIKNKLDKDRKFFKYILANYKKSYLSKNIDLEKAFRHMTEDNKNYFYLEHHKQFYSNKGHFKSYIEEYFNQ